MLHRRRVFYNKILLSLTLICLSIVMPRCQSKVDSFIQVLEQDLDIRTRILTHNRIARIYSNKDTTLALFHREQMDSLAVMHNDTLGKFLVAALRNIHYFQRSNFKKSEELLKEQLLLAEMMGRDDFKTGVNYELSLVKRAQDQLDSAVYYAQACYNLIEENPKVPLLNKMLTLNHLGSLSQEAYDYKAALKYYFKADSLSSDVEAYQVANRNGDVNLSIGGVYLRLRDTITAIKYYRKGLDQYKILDNYRGQSSAYRELGELYNSQGLDSSAFMLNKSLELAEKVGSQMLIASAHNSLGDYWFSKNDDDVSLYHYNIAYKIRSSTNNQKSLSGTIMRMARLEERNGNFDKALKLVTDASPYYEETGNLDGRYSIHYSKSIILEKMGRYKEGMAELLTAHDIKDSLNNAVFDKEVSELQIQYETAQKDKEILEQQYSLEKEESKRKRLWMLTALIGLIGLLSFIIMRSRLAYNKRLSEKNALIQSQTISELEKEKKILGMNAMIEGQEAERTRIAKDLHDGLGGLLSTVKAHFSNIQSEIQKLEKINVYNKANALVDEACDEVRRISHNLMPGALRLEGLKTAIEHFGEEMSEAHPFRVSTEVIGFDNRMEESKEIFIYRIIQEALNNIIKHANAKNVLIQLSETEQEYHFIVEDDGRGFDPLQIESGLGLKSIQSRVDFLKGSLDVDTKEGVGTTLSWHIPK